MRKAQRLLWSVAMNNGLLTQIRILDTDSIRPFEWEDSTSSRPTPSADDINLVRNPFPVLSLGDDSYLLLEEAPLFRLLSDSGLPHVPAQVYEAEDVRLAAERVALVDFHYDDLVNLIARHTDHMAIADRPGSPPPGFIEVVFEFTSGKIAPVQLRHSTRTGCADALDSLFRAIHSRGKYMPVVEHPAARDVVIKTISPSGFIDLPIFTLDDLRTAALSDRLFPPGLIRPLTSYRVVSIDFPISVLRSDISSDQKEAFLKELIIFREQSRKTAFYEGRIYILNL